MPCYHPRSAYRRANGVVSLREPAASASEGVEVVGIPCGYCIGCRVRKARDWAVRCIAEDREHEEACFVTLTYDDAHLPPSGLLVKAHLSGWLKRVRARIRADDVAACEAFWRSGNHGPFPVRKLRFFACGEYGEQTRRPHYHAILWGLRDSPHLQEAWSVPVLDASGRKQYDDEGELITEPIGFIRVDPCTPASISYVAGYVGKKVGDPQYRPETRSYWYFGERKRAPERRENPPIIGFPCEWDGAGRVTAWCSQDGEIFHGPVERPRFVIEKVPDPHAPFLLMSRRPGIGSAARDDFRSWRESAVFRGSPVPVPRYLHDSYKRNVSEDEYQELHAEKRAKMTDRLLRDRRYLADMAAAGEAGARALLAIKNERRKL